MKISTRISFIIKILIFFFIFSCKKNTHIISSKSSSKQDSLAFELCKIYGSDQGIRDMKLITKGYTGALKFSPYLDSINFFKVLDFVKKNGMPNEKLLGKKNFSQECVEGSVVSVLLHTPHMLVNNEEYMKIFLNEMKKGNLKEETFLTILDKYYVVRRDQKGNTKLLYGSQFGKPCIKFRKKSDSVRQAIGLKKLPDSMFVKCK